MSADLPSHSASGRQSPSGAAAGLRRPTSRVRRVPMAVRLRAAIRRRGGPAKGSPSTSGDSSANVPKPPKAVKSPTHSVTSDQGKTSEPRKPTKKSRQEAADDASSKVADGSLDSAAASTALRPRRPPPTSVLPPKLSVPAAEVFETGPSRARDIAPELGRRRSGPKRPRINRIRRRPWPPPAARRRPSLRHRSLPRNRSRRPHRRLPTPPRRTSSTRSPCSGCACCGWFPTSSALTSSPS